MSDTRDALSGNDTMKSKSMQTRVAPLKADDDGQDLPQRKSGTKSPLQSGRTEHYETCHGLVWQPADDGRLFVGQQSGRPNT